MPSIEKWATKAMLHADLMQTYIDIADEQLEKLREQSGAGALVELDEHLSGLKPESAEDAAAIAALRFLIDTN